MRRFYRWVAFWVKLAREHPPSLEEFVWWWGQDLGKKDTNRKRKKGGRDAFI